MRSSFKIAIYYTFKYRCYKRLIITMFSQKNLENQLSSEIGIFQFDTVESISQETKFSE